MGFLTWGPPHPATCGGPRWSRHGLQTGSTYPTTMFSWLKDNPNAYQTLSKIRYISEYLAEYYVLIVVLSLLKIRLSDPRLSGQDSLWLSAWDGQIYYLSRV